MLIFLDICSKKLFFQRDLKKSTFSLNFDIFEDMDKQRFFQSDLKKLPFPRNVDIYVDMEYVVAHERLRNTDLE